MGAHYKTLKKIKWVAPEDDRRKQLTEKIVAENKRKQNTGYEYFREYTCPICDKLFYVIHGLSNYTYKRTLVRGPKRNNVVVCSYTCLKELERQFGIELKNYFYDYGKDENDDYF